MQNSSNTQLVCKKHSSKSIKFICCFDGCSYGNLICETCLNSDPRHYQTHKSFIQETTHFFATQTKMSAKLIPSISETVQDLEKNYNEYCQNYDTECQELDKDFALLFKTFFDISEQAKTFLKLSLKGQGKEIGTKIQELKARMTDLGQSKKKDGNIFGILFPREQNEEIQSSSQEELVGKLVKKNSPLNLIRAESYSLSQDITTLKGKKIYYKRTQESKEIFAMLKDNFESSCKEMYRKFKALIEGTGDDDLRKSIFQGMKSTNSSASSSLANSIILNKQKAPVVSIDLSASPLKASQISLKEEIDKKPQRILKSLAQFPNFSNKSVLEAIRANGSFTFRIEDSYFNNQPEQGPYEMEDGSIYYGHISEKKRHGRGKAMFPDGGYYEGFWKDDIPYGIGRIIRSNGDLYQGQCLNFQAHGKGVFKTLKGDYLYNGEWQEDKKHGKGEEVVQQKYQFLGEFIYGKKQGTGEIKFTDGTIYSGHFQDEQITGEGTYKYLNGEQYVGEVKDGVKYGRGCYQWPDGRNYDGQYVNDIPHGKGIFIWPDGYIYNGSWLNGLQHGKGIEIDPEGKEREGEWENGKWKNWL